MSNVGRYAKMTAKPGMGEALAREMLEVAGSLRDSPGCQLYVINRPSGEPDVVWVTELWSSQEALEEALASDAAKERLPAVMELVDRDGFERVDLEPLGGFGYPVGVTGCSIVNLAEVEDAAARFGFGETGEARFARSELDASTVGLSLHRLNPGARQSFGHRHHVDEEIYVVLEGSGRVAVDDEVHEVRKRDAIRVGPASTRAFEAGPEGLEILATGSHRAGDAEMMPGYWAGQ